MSVTPPSPLQAFITARTGMALSGPQQRRLAARVAERLGGRGEHQYLQHLQSPAGAAELADLISAVVVHKTDLFRDEVQLHAFQAHVLAPLVARTERPLRVWSAGCATGEEVATLLVLLAEAGADPESTVLGTDISEPALTRARALSFGAEQMRRVPAAMREQWFVSLGSVSTLGSPLRERASFQHHNLMESPYPTAEGGGGFDIIFCRNVLIYFTPEAFERAVAGLAERLAPGGTLVLSAAEPLLQIPPSLRALRCQSAFFYVRAEDAAPPEAAQERRRRDAGTFPSLASLTAPPPAAAPAGEGAPAEAPARARESGRFPAVAPAASRGRDSGSFPGLAALLNRPRDSGSGSFPAVPPAPPAAAPPVRDSGRFPSVGPAAGAPRAESGRFPAVSPSAPSAPVRESGRFAAVGSAKPEARYVADPAARAEADALFIRILEGTAPGEGDARTEEDLRRCLTLDPDLAAARFLLGMLLELRDARAEAATEYRRALRSLEEGRARPVPFFLNHLRLQVACLRAIERMEESGPPR